VFMDCSMPVVDGFEATRRLRESERASGEHVHVIALTANAMKGDRERCLDAGMDDYIAKPVKPDLLLGKLVQHGSQARAEPRAAFDLEGLAQRYAGRGAQLRGELEQLERRSGAALAQLGASLRRESADEARAHLRELREALYPLSSERLQGLATELETLSGAGRFDDAARALHTLEEELARCSALAATAVARAEAR